MAAPVSAPTTPPASFRPEGRLDLGTALAPYRGAWAVRQAAHLLRRAGFGGSPDDVARLARGGADAALDGLVRFPDTSRLSGEPSLEEDRPAFLRAGGLMGAGAMLAPSAAAAGGDEAIKQLRMQIAKSRRANVIALQRWWLDRMIGSPAPLQEKMTLFWHGHFTSAMQKGIPARALLAQNELFRANALGNVRDLTLKVSQDRAMLRYLDNAQNVKAHPNENYARELMELFTLGIGNYTEADIRESARAFTGWSINRDWQFVDNPRVHDDGAKTFLGRSGAFTGRDIVQIIFQQPASSRWFATKLLNFFVYNDPEPELVDATAALIRKNDFELRPVLSTLLRSNVFFSDRAYRALVKSPVEFVVGSYQLFGIRQTDLIALAALRRMGQVLFYPPNVKGWDGGAAWLNSQTLLTRENFASTLMTKMTQTPWLSASVRSMQPSAVAQTLTSTILQDDVSPASTGKLVAYLSGSGVSELAMLSGENADERVRGAAYLTMALPAYQLA